jgi:hypothetical protein
MVEDWPFLFIAPDLPKAIHIKLPHERCEIGVFEVPRKDLVGQSRHILNDKGLFVISPTDDVEVLGVLSERATYIDDAEGFG